MLPWSVQAINSLLQIENQFSLPPVPLPSEPHAKYGRVYWCVLYPSLCRETVLICYLGWILNSTNGITNREDMWSGSTRQDLEQVPCNLTCHWHQRSSSTPLTYRWHQRSSPTPPHPTSASPLLGFSLLWNLRAWLWRRRPPLSFFFLLLSAHFQ